MAFMLLLINASRKNNIGRVREIGVVLSYILPELFIKNIFIPKDRRTFIFEIIQCSWNEVEFCIKW